MHNNASIEWHRSHLFNRQARLSETFVWKEIGRRLTAWNRCTGDDEDDDDDETDDDDGDDGDEDDDDDGDNDEQAGKGDEDFQSGYGAQEHCGGGIQRCLPSIFLLILEILEAACQWNPNSKNTQFVLLLQLLLHSDFCYLCGSDDPRAQRTKSSSRY